MSNNSPHVLTVTFFTSEALVARFVSTPVVIDQARRSLIQWGIAEKERRERKAAEEAEEQNRNALKAQRNNRNQ